MEDEELYLTTDMHYLIVCESTARIYESPVEMFRTLEEAKEWRRENDEFGYYYIYKVAPERIC